MAFVATGRWQYDQRFFLFLIGSGGSRIRIGTTMQLVGRPLRIASVLVMARLVSEVPSLLLETLTFFVRGTLESAIFLVL
jgi:hypothetical protein